MKVAIIGHAADKFASSPLSKDRLTGIARNLIHRILKLAAGEATLISGRSPLGGIDIWAEEIAKKLGNPTLIFAPKDFSWNGAYGFRRRNLDIAKHSDVVHVIVLQEYPVRFRGIRFRECYHCRGTVLSHSIPPHVKSGACWTAWRAVLIRKVAVWHVIKANGTITVRTVQCPSNRGGRID